MRVQVDPPKNSIKIGFEIEAECSLPLDLGYAYFYGLISTSRHLQLRVYVILISPTMLASGVY